MTREELKVVGTGLVRAPLVIAGDVRDTAKELARFIGDFLASPEDKTALLIAAGLSGAVFGTGAVLGAGVGLLASANVLVAAAVGVATIVPALTVATGLFLGAVNAYARTRNEIVDLRYRKTQKPFPAVVQQQPVPASKPSAFQKTKASAHIAKEALSFPAQWLRSVIFIGKGVCDQALDMAGFVKEDNWRSRAQYYLSSAAVVAAAFVPAVVIGLVAGTKLAFDNTAASVSAALPYQPVETLQKTKPEEKPLSTAFDKVKEPVVESATAAAPASAVSKPAIG